MKTKLFCCVLIACLTFCIVGCSCKGQSNPKPSPTPSVPASATQPTPSITTIQAETVNDRYLAVKSSDIVKDEDKLKTSFRDDRYYYYVFYLGDIKRVPLQENFHMFHYKKDGTDNRQQTLTTTQTTTEEFSQSISQAVTNTTNWEETVSQSATAKLEIKGKSPGMEVSGSFAYQNGIEKTFGGGRSQSIEEQSSKTVSYSIAEQLSVTFSFGENNAKGYYRYVLLGTIEVYALLMYDTQEKVLYTESIPYLAAKYYELDYSENEKFNDNEYGELTLPEEWIEEYNIPNEIPEKYYPSQSEAENGGDSEDPSENQTVFEKIPVNMTRYSLLDNKDYNKNNEETRRSWLCRHAGFEIGQLNLYGCKSVNDSFEVGNVDSFALRYEVLENLSSLPNYGDAEKTNLSSDTAKKAVGTNINKKIGQGAYYIRVTYTDDEQQEFSGTDILKNKAEGSFVTLLSDENIDKTKTLDKIEVVVLYELYFGGPGFIGIWWHDYMNFRCEYTFNFNN